MSIKRWQMNWQPRCDHMCHSVGLNPWVCACPVCGCENPNYDPEAKSDIVNPLDVLLSEFTQTSRHE